MSRIFWTMIQPVCPSEFYKIPALISINSASRLFPAQWWERVHEVRKGEVLSLSFAGQPINAPLLIVRGDTWVKQGRLFAHNNHVSMEDVDIPKDVIGWVFPGEICWKVLEDFCPRTFHVEHNHQTGVDVVPRRKEPIRISGYFKSTW